MRLNTISEALNLVKKVFVPKQKALLSCAGEINAKHKEISLEDYFSHNTINMEQINIAIKLNRLNPFQIDRILSKLEEVKDEKIVDFVTQKINYISGIASSGLFVTKSFMQTGLRPCEEILDAYNVLHGKYSMIVDVDKYYKYLKDINPKKAKNFAKFSSSLSEQTTAKKPLHSNFKNDIKFEALKIFITNNFYDQPDMVDYMYDAYYLSKLKGETQKTCKKIADYFGTKVFLQSLNHSGDLKFVYKELLEWDKISDGMAILPKIIDFSAIKKEYILKKDPSSGLYSYDNVIHIEGNNNFSHFTLRHEMAHCNDRKIDLPDENPEERTFRRLEKKNKFDEELTKGGIDSEDIIYSHKNKDELIAVAAEGDYSKYSDKFKKILNYFGLPQWVFDMTPVGKM